MFLFHLLRQQLSREKVSLWVLSLVLSWIAERRKNGVMPAGVTRMSGPLSNQSNRSYNRCHINPFIVRPQFIFRVEHWKVSFHSRALQSQRNNLLYNLCNQINHTSSPEMICPFFLSKVCPRNRSYSSRFEHLPTIELVWGTSVKMLKKRKIENRDWTRVSQRLSSLSSKLIVKQYVSNKFSTIGEQGKVALIPFPRILYLSKKWSYRFAKVLRCCREVIETDVSNF